MKEKIEPKKISGEELELEKEWKEAGGSYLDFITRKLEKIIGGDLTTLEKHHLKRVKD